MTQETIYDVGDLVRVSASFTDPSNHNAPIDPTAVSVTCRAPSGDESTFRYGVDGEVNRDGAGQYHINVDAAEPGFWQYRWFSTGTGQAAGQGQFFVRDLNVNQPE